MKDGGSGSLAGADGSEGPAERLLGMILKNGWRVVEKITPSINSTGGCFSVGYLVESENGERGFLKAFDFFSWVEDHADPARELQPLLAAYNYERDLLNKCKDRRLSRVVRAIDEGTVNVPGVPGLLSTVQYLIFELADGDVREQLDVSRGFDVAWALRALHEVAIGLNQLHGVEVVHQDLKPSNILTFEGKSLRKVADLGRAAAKGSEAPLVVASDRPTAGDRRYSPPENLYDKYSIEWNDRLARDAYHLGSMVVFFFTHASMSALLKVYLEPALTWDQWPGTFEEVLPYVQAAFEQALEGIRPQLPSPCREPLLGIIRELCNPDPKRRGHPLNHRFGKAPYSLERYVSQLNLLATQMENAPRRES